MLNKGKYHFLGESYNSEIDLAVALANNYGDALNYIFTSTFAEDFDNPYLRGRVKEEINRCRYAESALSMVLYLLNPSVGLYVNGHFFKTIQELADFLAKEGMNDTLAHLFADHGLTHTLALREELSLEKQKSLVFVEDNILNSGVYSYFLSVFASSTRISSLNGSTEFDTFLYSINNNKDIFNAYLTLINHDIFKSTLYQLLGFDKVEEIYSAVDYPIQVLEIFKKHSSYSDGANPALVNILNSGVDLYYANNYKKFKFKGIAKVFKRNFRVYCKDAKKANINDLVSLRSAVYSYKTLWQKAYVAGLISPKKPEYSLIKVHCDDFVSLEYLQSINVDASDLEDVKLISADDRKAFIKALKKEIKNQNRANALKAKVAYQEVASDMKKNYA